MAGKYVMVAWIGTCGADIWPRGAHVAWFTNKIANHSEECYALSAQTTIDVLLAGVSCAAEIRCLSAGRKEQFRSAFTFKACLLCKTAA
jgi:hypothetical protein